MNILFLEDEVELSAIGVEQLRNLGHTIYPALSLAEAQVILNENWRTLHLIIADHRLPDGAGIDFLMEVKQLYPRIKLAVVSGCLTPDDEHRLEIAEIPYYTKPLLYRQVMQKLRSHYMIKTTPPVPIPRQPIEPTRPSADAPDSKPFTPPPPKALPGEGLLAASGIQVKDPPKKRGLTSVIFSKLTKKN